MPELPEVETVRRSLAPRIVGQVFRSVDVDFPGCLEGLAPHELNERLRGRCVEGTFRLGKYLGFSLDSGASLVIHLRMTGRLIFCEATHFEKTEYTRAVFHFVSGKAVRFDDQRKFGRVMWFANQSSLERRLALGYEPFDPRLGEREFSELLSGRRRSIKSFLLDQKHIAGIGNIYADEGLFRAGIAPWRPAGTLSQAEAARLLKAVREVLAEGIEYKGTSLRDYVDGDGRKGGFQERLRVYGREGKPCCLCGAAVERVVLAGRSSFYCPRCQA